MAKVVKLGPTSTSTSTLTSTTSTTSTSLSKARALALQTELLAAYTTPKFQKKLHEIARKLDASDSNRASRASAYTAFKHLVRKSQREIIPRYGFDPSEEGVECMMKAFRNFQDDADIYVGNCAIKEALSLNETSKDNIAPLQALQSNKENVLLWLRRLVISFSAPSFQALKGERHWDAASLDEYHNFLGHAAQLGVDVTNERSSQRSRMGSSLVGNCLDLLREDADADVVCLFDAMNMCLGLE